MRRMSVLVVMMIMFYACGGQSNEEVVTMQTPVETKVPQFPTDELEQPPDPTANNPPKHTPIPTTSGSFPSKFEINSTYIMAFHACDSFNVDCHDPRNHKVYLAGADDVKTWSLISGWVPFQGSVPDVIRRGDTLYVYTGTWLVRYHFDTGLLDEPVRVEISSGEGMDSTESIMLTDVSLIRDDQDRLVMFFLFGEMGSDPAMCGPGEATCVKRIGSATEVDGSDGGSFLVNAGERIYAEIGEGKPFMSLSDPDIFTDGQTFYLLLSHGTWTSVWRSLDLHGDYQKIDIPPMGFLTTGSGGVASGHYYPENGRFWIFANIHLEEGMVIRFAETKDLARQLEEGAWVTILAGEEIGLGPGFNVESPGFTINAP